MDDNSKKHFKDYMKNVKEDINEEITKSMNNVVTASTIDVMTKNENVLQISSLASNIVGIRAFKISAAVDVNIAGNLKNKVDLSSVFRIDERRRG